MKQPSYDMAKLVKAIQYIKLSILNEEYLNHSGANSTFF